MPKKIVLYNIAVCFIMVITGAAALPKYVCFDDTTEQGYLAGEDVPTGKSCESCVCSKSGDILCAMQSCEVPTCLNYFVPKDECCPICNDSCVYNGVEYEVGTVFPDDCNECSCQKNGLVRCTEKGCGEKCKNGKSPLPGKICDGIAALTCPDHFTCEGSSERGADLSGQCCPDCQTVKCGAPSCKNPYTPDGQCCPVCPDCSKEICPAIKCLYDIWTTGACCPICGQDCTLTLCPQIRCAHGTIKVPGECCEKCKIATCTHNGQTYDAGDSFKDDCNTCQCTDSGVTICTLMACIEKCENGLIPLKDKCGGLLGLLCPKDYMCDYSNVPAGRFDYFGICCKNGCVYNGAYYEVGTVFPDDCNTCSCQIDGLVMCTEKSCGDKCTNGKRPLPGKICNGIAALTCPENFTCEGSSERGADLSGQCCPDCQTVKCGAPSCKNPYTPGGQCCPVCPDCSQAICPAIKCLYDIWTTGACCPICGQDCSTVRCAKPSCSNPFTPPGQCCPICPECSAVSCAKPSCSDAFVPEGECCPICPATCTHNGQTYEAGKTFKDDCNTCQCTDSGFVRCTLIACIDLCELPKDTGPCEALILRYFFNKTSGQCEQFDYGGCQGNRNNFESWKACQSTCTEATGTHNGQTYVAGDSFKDDCNTCHCTDSGVAICTLMACIEKCENGLLPIKEKCGGFVGLQCPEDYMCDNSNVPAGSADYFGMCCKIEKCENGLLPIKEKCGGFVGLQCPEDYMCDNSNVPAGSADYFGMCCKNCTNVKCEKSNCKNAYVPEGECCQICPVDVCEIPKDSGPCKAFFPRYFFNETSGQCDKFIYGGCQGNGNNFVSLKACQSTCNEVCEQPKKPGTCKGSFNRYFYNSLTQMCELFVYGGCGGNNNNFETQKECQATCSNGCKDENGDFYEFGADVQSTFPCRTSCKCTESGDIECAVVDCVFDPGCINPVYESGRCCPVCPKVEKCKNGLVPIKEKCGGKIGLQCPEDYMCDNSNVPAGSADFFGICCKNCTNVKCKKPNCENAYVPEGECCQICPVEKCENGLVPIENKCGGFVGLQCPEDYMCDYSNVPAGGADFFGICCKNCTNVKCEKPNCKNAYVPEGECCQICPVEKCENGLVPIENKCGGFVGLQCPEDYMCDYSNVPAGGADFFGICCKNCTNVKCEKTNCKNAYVPEGECCQICPVDVCELPKDSGPCKAFFPRYFFNKTSGQCDKFIYGGCQGNGNNFESLKACQSTCNEVCEQPKKPGTCKGSFNRYFYNSLTQMCELFVYGGCGGNHNNFETQKECQATCSNVCDLPVVPGPCKASLPRYFYDSETYTCGKFTYGGCKGNSNNFETLKNCQSTCNVEGCTIENGTVYEFGDDVPTPSTEPCREACMCTGSGKIICAEVACVDPGCKDPIYKKGKCCPVCPKFCKHSDGKKYKIGIRVPDEDPCKKCRCQEGGQVVCTAVICKPTSCKNPKTRSGKCCPKCPKVCKLNNGKRYKIGKNVPDEDPCKTCKCEEGGEVKCASATCEKPKCNNPITRPGKCCPECPTLCKLTNGKRYRVGCKVPCADLCKSCKCEEGGHVVCTTKDCFTPCKNPVIVPGKCCPKCPTVCKHTDGITYTPGQPVPTEDQCTETCVCTDEGQVECSELAIKCLMPICKNAKSVKGHCCPICPDIACYQTKRRGSCKGKFTRYFYNKETKQCESFIYGGCPGSQNRFETLQECRDTCKKASIKKGVAIDGWQSYHCGDEDAFTNINWWYDWHSTPWQHVTHNCASQVKSGYVPMVWGWRDKIDYPVYLQENTQYVLGFNEPNFELQANLTPQEAAQHWPQIETASNGRIMVSPAVAPGPKDPVMWLEEFFEECKGCRVDHIATHAYWCDTEITMNYLQDLWERFEKPIWLTEFACPETTSVEDQLQYMKAILPLLEEAPHVFRYAWFVSRTNGDGFVYPSASLLEESIPSLTKLGEYYDNF